MRNSNQSQLSTPFALRASVVIVLYVLIRNKLKITPLALACIALLPFTSLIAEAKNEWVSSDRDSTYTITANSEHLVQDRSVTYLPELPVELDKLDRYTITLEVESSDTEWSEAGIVFGGNEGNFHFLLINSLEKYYTYGSHEARDLNANWKDTAGMAYIQSDEIESTENKIQIKKRSQSIEFYINGKRIAKSDLPDLDGQRIGFYLRAPGGVFTVKYIKLQIK
jgi:hypothetical protein